MSIIFAALLALAADIVPAGNAYLKQLQERDSILVADQLEYGIVLNDVKSGTELGLQDFAEVSNDTLTLVRNWQMDTLKTKGKKSDRSFDVSVSVVLAPFEEGKYELPPIMVSIKDSDAGQPDTLVYEGCEFEVKSVPVDTASFEVKALKGQIRYPLTAAEIIPYTAGALLLAALVVFAVIFISRRRAEGRNGGKPKDPPHIVALRELDRYRSEKFWAPEKQKAFYSGVTDTLRAYMAERFEIDAQQMLTAELFDTLKGNPDLAPEMFSNVRELFETADFVKFAKYIADDSQNAKVLPLAVNFVTGTCKVVETEE